jgi:hypothetical protein
MYVPSKPFVPSKISFKVPVFVPSKMSFKVPVFVPSKRPKPVKDYPLLFGPGPDLSWLLK